MSGTDTTRAEGVGKSVEELMAYADAMEREAVRRYRQLSELMAAHNNRELAALFARMAEIEQKHVVNVGEYAEAMGIGGGTVAARAGAALDGAEIIDFGEAHYLQRPYHAIALAIEYEKRAVLVYEELARTAGREDVRKVALCFVEDERAHVKELEQWLMRYPKPEEDWDEDPDPPVESE